MYQIVESSDAVKAHLEAAPVMWAIPQHEVGSAGRKSSVYPFRAMMPGQSFAVQYDGTDSAVYNRTVKAASDASKKFKAKFICHVHEAVKLIEVGRIR